MAVVYDPDLGTYAEAPEDLCIARWASTGTGHIAEDICGLPGTRWAGDLLLCGHHFKRLMRWVAEEDDRSREAVLERQQCLHEQQMRHEEELNRRRMELDRERIAARAMAKSPYSVVYYVRRVSDGMIKIGTTGALAQRMSTLRGQHGPLQVLLVLGGDREEEAEAHRLFDAHRIGRTEWFRPARTLLEWICEARRDAPEGSNAVEILPLDELRALVQAAREAA